MQEGRIAVMHSRQPTANPERSSPLWLVEAGARYALQEREAGMPKETKDEQTRRKLDLELDSELRDTFPASDALKITRGLPKTRRASGKTDREKT